MPLAYLGSTPYLRQAYFCSAYYVLHTHVWPTYFWSRALSAEVQVAGRVTGVHLGENVTEKVKFVDTSDRYALGPSGGRNFGVGPGLGE